MVDINLKVKTEFENIKNILSELNKVKDRYDKELVVIAGIGAFLQNIYSGFENILK